MNANGTVIVDYGVGNLFNVQRALEAMGRGSRISRDPHEILDAERLILPGVGAFETGMRHLREYGLLEAIRTFSSSGRPLLGICLGMQLLMTESAENGLHQGLGLIPGRVVRFREPEAGAERYKIPQIGWNALLRPASSRKGSPDDWHGTLLEGLGDRPYMYFVHSFCVYPEDPSARLAQTRYGCDEFTSVVVRGNLAGCQFHPERSGDFGLRILGNFLNGKLGRKPS